MTDILIRGKDLLLPERSGEILDVMLFADGTIQYGKHYGFAFELQEHGDLIDADSLTDDLLYDVELAERALDDTFLVGKEREYTQSEKDIKQNCAYYVSHAPVVIPSNKED